MTNPTYIRAAATAKRLLTKFGQDVTLVKASAAAYDPAQAAVAAAAPTESTLKGAVFDFGPGVTTERGNLVRAEDKQLLLEPGVTPTTADAVRIGATEYSIVSVGEINPGGTSVMFTLHLRA